MDNLYKSTIHNRSQEFRDLILEVANKSYTPSSTDNLIGNEELNKEKEIVIKSLEDLCVALFQKIEFLNYRLQTIMTFDWNYRENLENINPEERLDERPMRLHGDRLQIKFNHKDTIAYFIFFEVSGFMSTLSSIIDLLAELLRFSFRVKVKGMPTIINVNENISDKKLRIFIQEKFCTNYSFYGMRHIRTHCEHGDHSKILNVIVTQDFPRRTNRVLAVKINKKLMASDFPLELADISESDNLNVYCEFLYKKIVENIEEFFTVLCEIRETL